MTDWWPEALAELAGYAFGLRILLTLFFPCTVIGVITRFLLRRQTSKDGFDQKRFNRFTRDLAIPLFIILEAYFLYSPEIDLYRALLWVGSAAIVILMWKYPEQIPNLSVFPESLIDPILAKTGRVASHLPRPKGFLTSMIRGDQLETKKARRMMGIEGDRFYCFRCRKERVYPDEFGATLFIKKKKRNVCADCVQALPQLKVADLRRWM